MASCRSGASKHGYDAFERGVAVECNPYKEHVTRSSVLRHPVEFRLWYEGWFAAQENHFTYNHCSRMVTRNTKYAKGRTDYRRGVPAYGNPYSRLRSPTSYAQWNLGWGHESLKQQTLGGGHTVGEITHTIVGLRPSVVIVDEIGTVEENHFVGFVGEAVQSASESWTGVEMKIEDLLKGKQKQEADMNTELQGTHTVGVRFFAELQPNAGYRSSKHKVYQYLTDMLLQKGDYVIVNSPSTGYTCVIVEEFYEDQVLNPNYKWVIDRVDDSAYKERIERVRRLAELESSLKARAKQLADVSQYETFANMDANFAAMLREYKNLKGIC